jgi:hypothetical protein
MFQVKKYGFVARLGYAVQNFGSNGVLECWSDGKRISGPDGSFFEIGDGR